MKFMDYFSIFLLFCLFSHISDAQSLDNARIASDDAVLRLEEALSGGNSSSSVQTIRGGARPSWVTDPYSSYSKDRYIAAVGFAPDRTEAEKRAFAALTAFFGQSIRADYEVASVYSEAVTNGFITVSENTNVRDTIITAVSLDSLIGAEIRNVWDDGRGTVNVLALMEKARTISIYTDLLIINNRNIELLTSVSAEEKNTFDGYARFKLASLLAGINTEYAGIVTLAGGSTASLNLTSADALNLETQNIIRNISVGFNVTGDSNNRVRDSFAKVLNAEGLRTQGRNAPYTLDISINMSEARFPNNNFIFCRYTVDANLIERNTDSVILTFSVTEREGHTTYEEAKARSYLRIEKMVAERYPVLFREYLTGLLPWD